MSDSTQNNLKPMTSEEAKRYILENWFDGDKNVKSVVGGDKETMAMKIAVESIEKQIPKEPYWRVEEEGEGWACPACNMGVTIDGERIRERFCSDCGQSLDWRLINWGD